MIFNINIMFIHNSHSHMEHLECWLTYDHEFRVRPQSLGWSKSFFNTFRTGSDVIDTGFRSSADFYDSCYVHLIQPGK